MTSLNKPKLRDSVFDKGRKTVGHTKIPGHIPEDSQLDGSNTNFEAGSDIFTINSVSKILKEFSFVTKVGGLQAAPGDGSAQSLSGLSQSRAQVTKLQKYFAHPDFEQPTARDGSSTLSPFVTPNRRSPTIFNNSSDSPSPNSRAYKYQTHNATSEPDMTLSSPSALGARRNTVTLNSIKESGLALRNSPKTRYRYKKRRTVTQSKNDGQESGKAAFQNQITSKNTY